MPRPDITLTTSSTSACPRVGYVTKMYPRFSETFIVNEVRGLERRGVEIEIFSLRAPVDTRFHAALADVAAPVRYVPRATRTADAWSALASAHERLDLRALPAATLADLLAADPEDAVQALWVATAAHDAGLTHLHAHFGSVATTVARLAAAVLGIGFTFTAHAKDIFHESVDPADLRVKLADARAVVTVSDHNLRYLHDTYGPDADAVVRVYNGLDLDEYARAAAPRLPGRVCAVGRLVEKKGFGDLLDALALLVADGRDVHLDLVGSGPQEADLRGRAAALGLLRDGAERVTFHGPLPQDRVRDVVARAAVFAAPCVLGADGNRDGLPTVLLEAMALGTPVVSTPVTGIPEAVRDGATGRLVPPGDVPALAAAVGALLDDEQDAARLADGARALIEAEFDVVGTSRRLLDVLESAAAPAAEGRAA
ncbi:glycosyltransferase [Krasilnikoviella flava]|uniref:Glycosyltransferase involved in cell wall bisynthesis n=1 Tax=Krasilnikoviella flava TaxID=526729 RepID=A0A1T5INR6_9MICO|nr:glycosyltransferase [Krasilnikoviella flava]SKC40613.1 Glycosyltransferase involved in cell wall bisynthesis [Krasilnikoviella flava]